MISKHVSNKRPDIAMARKFLNILTGDSNGKALFQTFSDSKNKEDSAHLTKQLLGSIDELWPVLWKLNKVGAGIFVTVNETRGKRRKAEDVIKLRALFVDKDDGDLRVKKSQLDFSVVVQAKQGQHGYFCLLPGESLERFKSSQTALIHHFQTDPSIKDISRVMRLPGFYHMKNPDDPLMVNIVRSSTRRYTIDEIMSAYPPSSPIAKLKTGNSKSVTGNKQKFMAWADALPTTEGSENPFGGRNCTLLILIREALACGLKDEEILEKLKIYCGKSGEAFETALEMFDRQKLKHDDEPFERLYTEENSSAQFLSKSYLLDRGFLKDDVYRLHFYRGSFFRYTEGFYKKMAEADIHNDVMTFLQSGCGKKSYATINKLNNVVANIEALTFISDSMETPIWQSLDLENCSDQILMKNGIFDLSGFLRGQRNPLTKSTPDFFCTAQLPYSFRASAKCPIWMKFLNEILPVPEVRCFLQEWFGYNLIFDTSQQKFVLFVGEGANGKSVVCTVLRSILGKNNVSAVALEQFSPTRTFPVSATIGKLANIVEEIGEVEKAAEGVLKDFSGGGTMTIERKHKDPFEAKITARLTFATNSVPKFRDRSGALWRRMIPIPFSVQILDEEKQDKRLTDSEWWESSEELPGIFKWAIEGLARLKKRGMFDIPKECAELRDEYKQESNPARTFLYDHCISRSDIKISSKELYRSYHQSIKDQGGFPLGESQFSKEVKVKDGHEFGSDWVG
jgi:putative DNA primase/helicase